MTVKPLTQCRMCPPPQIGKPQTTIMAIWKINSLSLAPSSPLSPLVSPCSLEVQDKVQWASILARICVPLGLFFKFAPNMIPLPVPLPRMLLIWIWMPSTLSNLIQNCLNPVALNPSRSFCFVFLPGELHPHSGLWNAYRGSRSHGHDQ